MGQPGRPLFEELEDMSEETFQKNVQALVNERTQRYSGWAQRRSTFTLVPSKKDTEQKHTHVFGHEHLLPTPWMALPCDWLRQGLIQETTRHWSEILPRRQSFFLNIADCRINYWLKLPILSLSLSL